MWTWTITSRATAGRSSSAPAPECLRVDPTPSTRRPDSPWMRAQDFTKLRRLDSAVVDATLTDAEVKAIAQHLGESLKQPADALTALVRRASVVDHERRTPENELDAGRPPEPSDVVYERGFPANFATLVLSGKLSVKAGVDGFRAEAGPWTLLGAGALRDENFVPDFSAHVATCVEIKILRRATG